ncbi:MAG: repair protein NreA [Methanohalophilus sp.]|nr:repair protein NreA [Methanohalophilus sp.]
MCGRPTCPILEKIKTTSNLSFLQEGKKDVFGASPPAVFVGRYGYPQVKAGPMIPPDVLGDDALDLEDPKKLLKMGIDDIIRQRCSLVRASTLADVKQPLSNQLIEKAQELALSSQPVDAEARFSKPLKATTSFDGVMTPMGPSGKVEKFDLAENPRVPAKVDYLAYDTDALAKDVTLELFNSNIGTEHITRLLSIGLLGQKRKLVPTRWAITATDDMIGKELAKQALDYPEVKDIQLFSGGCLGNHFEILLYPRTYSFELLEIWMKKTVWSGANSWIGQDMEGAKGKKGYSNLAGGYYAARLPVLEHFQKTRRQAAIFAIREITPEYWAPLGVWVVREAARNTMTRKPQTFETLEGALMDMEKRIHTPRSEWQSRSEILQLLQKQTSLSQFLN